jgi:hypothetical protein
MDYALFFIATLINGFKDLTSAIIHVYEHFRHSVQFNLKLYLQ